MNTCLYDLFLRGCRLAPDACALEVDDDRATYSRLNGYALSVMQRLREVDDNPLVAVYCDRDLYSYAGVLGIVASGKGYVPLNERFPKARTVAMLRESTCSAIIVGQDHAQDLADILADTAAVYDILVLHREGAKPPRMPGGNQRWHPVALGAEAATESEAQQGDWQDTAYVMFTSGSTGTPKGVPISNENVVSYVEHILGLYDISPADRCSQFFDLTFDLSVHDLFVTWASGACLCVVPKSSTLAPGRFLRESALTVWFAVPSVLGFMNRMRMLKPGSYPTLRLSLFCGEPLPLSHAGLWQASAPNCVVDNLYGPTEATIAISSYRFKAGEHPEPAGGSVPIGHVFTSQGYRVVDDSLQEVPLGVHGELLLSGSQISSGYLNAKRKTQEHFVVLDDDPNRVWYRTGDLVHEDEASTLHYVARVDHQVKIRGYRVELHEIEGHVRSLGLDFAVAVPWPVAEGTAQGVVLFADDGVLSKEAILAGCQSHFPEYMVPQDVRFLKHFPLNANGKINRNELKQMLEDGRV